MADREEILRVMRDYFSRPSSVHHDPEFTIKWDASGMPFCNYCSLDEIRMNDAALLEIFHEAVRRGAGRAAINWFGEED